MLRSGVIEEMVKQGQSEFQQAAILGLTYLKEKSMFTEWDVEQ